LNVFKLTFLSQTSPSVCRVSFKYPTTYQKQQRYLFSSLLVKYTIFTNLKKEEEEEEEEEATLSLFLFTC